MAEFNVVSRNGSVIAVPDYAKLQIDGLTIIGDLTTDWNEPIQQSLMVLDKKIYETEQTLVTEVADIQTSIDAVQSSLTNEISTRETSVTGLQNSLNSEITNRQNAVSALRTDAYAYADNGDVSVLANAKTYTDNKDATVLVDSKLYTDNSGLTVLNSAKNYSEIKSLEALSSAKTYTDSAITAIKNGASDILDTFKEIEDRFSTDEAGVVAINTELNSKANTSYVDSEVSSVLTTAKDYTDTKATSTLALANSYTNMQVSVKPDKSYVDNQCLATLTTASIYTDSAIANVINLAPAALDTLGEIAIELANNESAASALTSQVSNKVDKVVGKGLSTEDYTTTEKSQLSDLVLFKQNYGTITEFATAFDSSK